MAEPSRQGGPSFDGVLARHGLAGEKAAVIEALDRSLAEALSHHRVAAPTKRRAALLARGGFRAAEEGTVRNVAAQAAADYAAVVETALSTAQVAELLGLSQSRVRQLSASRSLTFLPGKPRHYPSWQFSDRGLLPNITSVLREADEALDAVGLWRFFVTADPDLVFDGEPLSPSEWLAAGAEPDRVRERLADL